MASYAIYNYQFERIIHLGHKQMELDFFPPTVITDAEWEKRLETFREVFKKIYSGNDGIFNMGRSTYVSHIIFEKDNLAVMKFGRLSNKHFNDAQLKEHKVDDYPWCYVIWDNRDGMQRMLIEQKPSAWPNSKKMTGTRKVAKALSAIADEWLAVKNGMHFSYGDGPVYKSDDFWDYVKLYPNGFKRVYFSFPPPNLGRLMDLADNFVAIRNETGGGIDADLKASKGGVLKLVPENPQTKSLVDLSSACGSEVKAYPKDGHTVIRISGDNLDNDVAVEVPDELIPILTSPQLFNEMNYSTFVEIVNSVKNLY